MTAHVALDAQAHKHLKLDATKVEEMGADLHMIPVVLSEFMKLVVQYPILFTKHAETGEFTCICLTGFTPGENLFWHNAEFDALYIPLNVRRHPFFVGHDDTGKQDYVICFDANSPILNTEQGDAIFNDDGSASEVLINAQDQLSELLVGERETQSFIQALLDANLLVPLSLDITLGSGIQTTVKGLYSIDEDKLNALGPAQLAQLNHKGYLQAAYTQVASLGQIYSLIQRKNHRDNAPNPWMQQ